MEKVVFDCIGDGACLVVATVAGWEAQGGVL